MQRAQLQAAEHVARLIQRRVRPVERASHLTLRVGALEPHCIDEELHRLLRRHLAEVEVEREDDARAPVHAPHQCAHSVLRLRVKAMIPEEHLPVQRLSLVPERRREQLAMRVVARHHEPLEMMAGIELVEYDSAREMRIVAAQAHELVFVRHVRGGI